MWKKKWENNSQIGLTWKHARIPKTGLKCFIKYVFASCYSFCFFLMFLRGEIIYVSGKFPLHKLPLPFIAHGDSTVYSFQLHFAVWESEMLRVRRKVWVHLGWWYPVRGQIPSTAPQAFGHSAFVCIAPGTGHPHLHQGIIRLTSRQPVWGLGLDLPPRPIVYLLWASHLIPVSIGWLIWEVE